MSTELKVGDPAPDFKGTAVGGIYGGGQQVKLADFAAECHKMAFQAWRAGATTSRSSPPDHVVSWKPVAPTLVAPTV